MSRSLNLRFCLPFVLVAACGAQLPNAPLPQPDPSATSNAWTDFTSHAKAQLGKSITVRGRGWATRCVLDEVTPDGIFCHFDAGHLWWLPMPSPSAGQRISRQDIDVIRVPDKAASTLLGIGLGFGVAAAIGYPNNHNLQAQDLLYVGILPATVGGIIGHNLPLIHHTLYRVPKP